MTKAVDNGAPGLRASNLIRFLLFIALGALLYTLFDCNYKNANTSSERIKAPLKRTSNTTLQEKDAPDAVSVPLLPSNCQAYMKGHTLSLVHGRYVHEPGRNESYDHKSCFLMKPRYNCATTDQKKSKAYEWKFILQSDRNDPETLCDIGAIVEDLSGPAAIQQVKKVLLTGNSYMRQIYEAIACKYHDQLTQALVLANPPDMSLANIAKRRQRPFNLSEYGTITSLPLDKKPLPLCAGNVSIYEQFFETNINVTTADFFLPHCSDDLSMMEFDKRLKIFYHFRPYLLNDTFQSAETLVGLNPSELSYAGFNDDADKVYKLNSPRLVPTLSSVDFSEILPTLKKIQMRDAGVWFGADNVWITHKPDNHPCMPGVPDDEAALFLFAIIFDIHNFEYG